MIFRSWSTKSWLSWFSMWNIWNTVWIRCWGNCLHLLGFWNFFVFFRFFPLKLVYFWTKSRKNIYGCFFHSFCATDLYFAIYWGCPLVQFSKLQNFLGICWFLDKNISNFVSPVWKLHNPYCHIEHSHGMIS